MTRWMRITTKLVLVAACVSCGSTNSGLAQSTTSTLARSASTLSVRDSGRSISAASWPASEPHEFGGGGIRARLVVEDGCLAIESSVATRKIAVPSTMRLATSTSGVVVEPISPSSRLSTVTVGEVVVFGIMDTPPSAAESPTLLVATVGQCGPADSLLYWSGSTSQN